MLLTKAEFIWQMREALDALEAGHFSVLKFDSAGDCSFYINRSYGQIILKVGVADLMFRFFESTPEERSLFMGVPEHSAAEFRRNAAREAAFMRNAEREGVQGGVCKGEADLRGAPAASEAAAEVRDGGEA